MLRWRSRTWVVLGSAISAAGAFAGACSDDDPSIPARPDSSVDSEAGVAAGICPKSAPENGDSCTLPEGTTCSFGECGTKIAECRAGAWRYRGNPPPSPVCPAPEPPPSESACPPCWPVGVTCSYGTCQADASTNTAIASCPNGTWVLEFFECPLFDAGADVQGDSGPDAD